MAMPKKMAECHPDRWHYAKGLCRKCWSREYTAEYRKTHRQYFAKIQLEYYYKNRERELERMRLAYLEHRDIRDENTKKYKREHPEQAKKYRKKWSKEHKVALASYSSKYRSKKAGNGGTYTEKEFIDLCNKYDNRCLRCGEKKPLTADHVIPVSKGGPNVISNIQPLCQPCNSIKHRNIIDYREQYDETMRNQSTTSADAA